MGASHFRGRTEDEQIERPVYSAVGLKMVAFPLGTTVFKQSPR